jgi:fused signal recognition particle receptor
MDELLLNVPDSALNALYFTLDALSQSLIDDVTLTQGALALSLLLGFVVARDRRLLRRRSSQQTAPQATSVPLQKTVALPVALDTLSDRLVVSRRGLLGKLKELFGQQTKFDQEVREDLEELLISSDVGVQTTERLIAHLEKTLGGQDAVTFNDVQSELYRNVLGLLQKVELSVDEFISRKSISSPRIIMMIGVNGAGKTTTSAKLAKKLSEQGERVLLVAADTFRAAAVEQLKEWGKRLDVPVFSSSDTNSKPSAVVYQALEQARQENVDVVLIDTAGRLHNRKNLMQEIEGIRNAVQKQMGRPIDETVLVLDGTSGQNALIQAREFHAVAPLTGLIITKLDGTPKGGVVVAVANELAIPLLYIGVGEKVADLRHFRADEFAEALLSTTKVEPAHAQRVAQMI